MATTNRNQTQAINPSLIVFLDEVGNLKAESFGSNGNRKKIDLPVDAPELAIQTLIDELNSVKRILIARAEKDRQLAEKTRQRQSELGTIPTIEDEQTIKFLAASANESLDPKRLDREWLKSLTKDDFDKEMARRAEIQEKMRGRENSRARNIWLEVATSHNVDLANRVIDDPARRPNRHFTIDGRPGTFSPRTYDPSGKTIKKVKKLKHAIKGITI